MRMIQPERYPFGSPSWDFMLLKQFKLASSASMMLERRSKQRVVPRKAVKTNLITIVLQNSLGTRENKRRKKVINSNESTKREREEKKKAILK